MSELKINYLKKKNRNDNKKTGASLIYILVVLSIITIFSINFIYFVKERWNIVILKEKSENDISIKYLQNMELKNVSRNKMEQSDYFGKKITIDVNGIETKEQLIYLRKDEKSFGEFYIAKIKSNNIEINFPLEKNTVYNNLEVYYEKEVLGQKLTYIEKIAIKRVSSTETEVIIKNGEFVSHI